MNWKTWMPVTVAILLGIVAVKVGKDMIAHNGSGQQGLTSAKVVILTADVQPGQAIKESDVTIGHQPAGTVPNGTFTSVNDVVGRVPQVTMVRGETVLENLLQPIGTMPGLPSLIPDGMRAVTIEVDEIRGVAGMLQPGCHIDLVSTIGGDGTSTARAIVENLTVLAVGRRYNNAQPEADPSQGIPRAITLLATPRQCEMIELATHVSNPRLVLRGSRDISNVNLSGVTLAELRGKKMDTDNYSAALNQLLNASKNSTTAPPVAVGNATPATVPAQPSTVYVDVQVLRNGVETHVKLPVPVVVPAPSTLVENAPSPAPSAPATQPTAMKPAVAPATQPVAEQPATQPVAIQPATQPEAMQPATQPEAMQPATQPADSSASATTQPASGTAIHDAAVDLRPAFPNGKN